MFHDLGGRAELLKFAKNNPGKFYDQLLRLLISMEAPKQSMNLTLNIEQMAEAEGPNDQRRAQETITGEIGLVFAYIGLWA